MENLREGIRFRPSDAEGLTFLLRFVSGHVMNDSGFITTNVDTYGIQEPWETYTHGVPCGYDDGDCTPYRFFITKLKKKKGLRYCRNVGNKGTWKQQDKSKPVQKNGGPVIGFKKSMTYVNKGYDKKNGNWLMKEYELSPAVLEKLDDDWRHYVLCALKKRTISTGTKVLNNIPEETRSNDLGRNLERETSAFLKFQESAHESAVESTSTTNLGRNLELETPAFLKFQESASESTSTSNYDAGDYNMQSKSVPALELNQLIAEDLEVLGNDAGDFMLNFDHGYLPDLNPWDILLDSDDILLDSDDIDQILQGTWGAANGNS